jgi:hypothetical protein
MALAGIGPYTRTPEALAGFPAYVQSKAAANQSTAMMARRNPSAADVIRAYRCLPPEEKAKVRNALCGHANAALRHAVAACEKYDAQVTKLQRKLSKMTTLATTAKILALQYIDQRNRKPSEATREQDKEIVAMRGAGKKQTTIASHFGIAVRSVRRAVKRHNQRHD